MTNKTLAPVKLRLLTTFSLATLSMLCSFSAYSEQTDEERIKSLEQRLLELEQQVQKQGLKSSTATKKSQKLVIEKKVLVIPKTKQRPSYHFTSPDKSILLSNSETTLQLGGQIWLDAIYNNGEMTNRAGFQTSSIAYENDVTKDNTLFSVGQSFLSLKSYTPTDYGIMTTRFEFDMFDKSGNADFHLTQLWGEIGDFGAGQTFSGFMDIHSFPNMLDFWGPNSMVFARQPQVRYTTAVSNSGKIMFTLEKSSSDFALPKFSTGSILYNDINELPDLTVSYLHEADFGYIKSAMVFRQLGYETATIKDTTLGWGLNVTGSITLTSTDSIKFQMAYGKGIGYYINDSCCSYYNTGTGDLEDTGGSDAGLDANGNLTAIPTAGGFAYYNKQWNEKWSSAIGYSYLTINNLVTQKDKSLKNSAYSTANIIWYPDGQIKAGVEVQYGDVQSKSGLQGDNYRIQASVGFKY